MKNQSDLNLNNISSSQQQGFQSLALLSLTTASPEKAAGAIARTRMPLDWTDPDLIRAWLKVLPGTVFQRDYLKSWFEYWKVTEVSPLLQVTSDRTLLQLVIEKCSWKLVDLWRKDKQISDQDLDQAFTTFLMDLALKDGWWGSFEKSSLANIPPLFDRISAHRAQNRWLEAVSILEWQKHHPQAFTSEEVLRYVTYQGAERERVSTTRQTQSVLCLFLAGCQRVSGEHNIMLLNEQEFTTMMQRVPMLVPVLFDQMKNIRFENTSKEVFVLDKWMEKAQNWLFPVHFIQYLRLKHEPIEQLGTFTGPQRAFVYMLEDMLEKHFEKDPANQDLAHTLYNFKLFSGRHKPIENLSALKNIVLTHSVVSTNQDPSPEWVGMLAHVIPVCSTQELHQHINPLTRALTSIPTDRLAKHFTNVMWSALQKDTDPERRPYLAQLFWSGLLKMDKKSQVQWSSRLKETQAKVHANPRLEVFYPLPDWPSLKPLVDKWSNRAPNANPNPKFQSTTDELDRHVWKLISFQVGLSNERKATPRKM